MYARVMKVNVPTSEFEDRVAAYRRNLEDAQSSANGCGQTRLLANEERGELLLVTVWDSIESMQQSKSSGLFDDLTSRCGYLTAAAPDATNYKVVHGL